MTAQEQHDREDLNLMQKYVDKHRARGTTPHPDSYARYVALLARVAMTKAAA